MAVGTIRYWAAARAAAGVAEESYDATTLAEALAVARARHGDALARVLDRCSYVVDDAPVGGRAHSDVLLRDGGSVEVLPPFAGGAAAGTMTGVIDAGRPSRAAAVGPGVAAGAVAAALAGLALLGTGGIGAGVFVVQAVLAVAWLSALGVRGGGGAFVIAVGAAAVADVLVATAGDPDVGRAAGVGGVALVVSLLHQLARRPRTAVTASLGGTVSAVALMLCASAFVALRIEGGGDAADAAALLGAGAALAAARVADVAVPHPTALPGSRRGVVGLVLGVGVAVLVGWGYGAGTAVLGGDHGVRLAVVGAALALVADLAVDAVLCAAPPSDARARAALSPLGVLLPVVLAGPAAYVAGRILLG